MKQKKGNVAFLLIFLDQLSGFPQLPLAARLSYTPEADDQTDQAALRSGSAADDTKLTEQDLRGLLRKKERQLAEVCEHASRMLC